MLPLSYAVRNLFRVPARLVQMVFGSALVVLLILAAASFSQGMASALSASGSAKNVILLGAGSEESVERSEVSAAVPGIVQASVRGLDKQLGQSAVSGEVHYNGVIQLTDQPGDHQITLRGVTPRALLVHTSLRLTQGTFPGPGEIMVGCLSEQLLKLPPNTLGLDRTIRFEGREFRISGIFSAPGTVLESELWMDQVDLMTQTQRDSLSCVVLRLGSAEFADVDLFAKQRLDLEIIALRESDYFANLGNFFAPIRLMVWITALLIAAGAVFGGLNTLYAAFASRIRELATLQAIGYSRVALYMSLLQESLLATMIGTFIACLAAIMIFDSLTVPFSTGMLRLEMGTDLLIVGLLCGVTLGCIGSIPPALSCLTRKLTLALRAG